MWFYCKYKKVVQPNLTVRATHAIALICIITLLCTITIAVVCSLLCTITTVVCLLEEILKFLVLHGFFQGCGGRKLHNLSLNHVYW